MGAGMLAAGRIDPKQGVGALATTAPPWRSTSQRSARARKK